MRGRRIPVLFALLLTLDAALYLTAALLRAETLGFPLDDSWIHQTLARNLAAHGQLAINPGEPVAASTSPLWSLALAVGYLLRLPNFLWAYALGLASLALTAWQTFALGRVLFPQQPAVALAAGLIVLLEWHLVWGALSGMETLLFTGLSLAVLREAVLHRLSRPGRIGVLVGLLTLTRPEGLLLGALVGGWGFLKDRSLTQTAYYGLWCGVFFLPWIGVNLALNGQPLPSTFYGKSAAYGIGLDPGGYLSYLTAAAVELARGPVLLAYPGIIYGLTRWPRRPGARWQLPTLWAVALLAVYMLWLPALYHHGRYLVPLIPLALLLGLEGGRLLFAALPYRLLARTALTLLAVVALAGWLRGAAVYGDNVRLISGQQVALALWLRDNAPPGAVVATHDIGALGYFSGRRVVDMAGLATPELATAAHDVPRIIALLRRERVDYLLIQPAWRPPLYQAILHAFNPARVRSDGVGATEQKTFFIMRLNTIQ